ncbi:hypothetical protein CSOJ01_05046 [Colletotrichum sojae]|uniref:Uncharacterized protein n=1 Tax=Colletotrichum sojae TaxID=2175907 RepID=A0A8H6MXH6_9PEZI|nr:hypothetical protein CSOJ01_05046 [Colletotrichum sojae]
MTPEQPGQTSRKARCVVGHGQTTLLLVRCDANVHPLDKLFGGPTEKPWAKNGDLGDRDPTSDKEASNGEDDPVAQVQTQLDARS